jgi:hypothetical protein
MPGISNLPTRPRRLISLSPERIRYSSGPGIFFALFGLLFSSTGLIVLGIGGWSVLILLGALPPQDGKQLPIVEWLLQILVLLAIGGGHFIGGSILLWTLRTTLDRARDRVIVRSGWLGLRCQRRRLSEFTTVTILPGSSIFDTRRRDSLFDIALRDESGAVLVVGQVSRSQDLARTVVAEISQFMHLLDAPPQKIANRD